MIRFYTGSSFIITSAVFDLFPATESPIQHLKQISSPKELQQINDTQSHKTSPIRRIWSYERVSIHNERVNHFPSIQSDPGHNQANPSQCQYTDCISKQLNQYLSGIHNTQNVAVNILSIVRYPENAHSFASGCVNGIQTPRETINISSLHPIKSNENECHTMSRSQLSLQSNTVAPYCGNPTI